MSNQKQKKILITGTTGWLGKELATKLSSKQADSGSRTNTSTGTTTSQKLYEIYGLARRPTEIPGVQSLQADICCSEELNSVLSCHDFDVVVHLAGAAGWCTLQQGLEINVNGTRNLLEATRRRRRTKKQQQQKYVVASSVAVTGSCSPHHPPKKLPIDNEAGFVEGSPWAYGLSKHMVEEVVKFISGAEAESEAGQPKDDGCDDGDRNEDEDGGSSHSKADYLLVRIGGVVTDPPLPPQHLETAIDETIVVEPAVSSDCPKEAILPESPLLIIALSDILRCLSLAVEAEFKPGVRTITAVGPSVFSKEPVVDVMTSWYGEKASDINMDYHRQPGKEYSPIYDTTAAETELGFVAKVDFRKLLLDS